MASEQKAGRKFRLPQKWKSYLMTILFIIGAFLFAFRDEVFGPETDQLAQVELLQKARQGQVEKAIYKDDTHLVVTLKGDQKNWEVTYPQAIATDTFKALGEAGVVVKPEKTEGFPWDSLLTLFLIVMWAWIILAVFVPFTKNMIAKAKGQVVQGTRPGTKFDDVKGLDEVVTELKKLANILENPAKYTNLGARLPAGLVLYGPPGTGKTLLAKALAGEARVPFFEVTGSSVRSMWMGQAGKAIRAHFEKARAYPVSIIFFDEGDTIGGRRSSSKSSGGDQEHRAMVNELLAQMNPDRPGGKVFVIIATNDPDLLDEALTRPGRIDLKLAVLPPDVKGRKAILGVHTKGKPLGSDVDIEGIAKETYGQTGAALEALSNNAALEAGTRGSKTVDRVDFDHALTVMRSGPARTSLAVSQHDKRVTAFHEAGHALCAAVLDEVPNPTGITILAHGYSGGHTLTVPDEDTASQYTSIAAAKQRLVMYMGGVAGEKLALDGDFTNGASSDRTAATNLAIEMVCHWGMGTYNVAFDPNWRNGPHADKVWEQVEDLLDEAELAAFNLLLQYKTAFDTLVEELLEKETLRASDLEEYSPAPVSSHELADLRKEFAKVLDGLKTRSTDRRVS